jgi:hypothetical protein
MRRTLDDAVTLPAESFRWFRILAAVGVLGFVASAISGWCRATEACGSTPRT